MSSNVKRYRYFKPSEFEKCTPSCSIDDMDPVFMRMLDEARTNCLFPFVLTSAYRSPVWEKEHGRSGQSSHTKGCAVDISCRSSITRLAIVSALLDAGFPRIGISSTFIHVDNDQTKTGCLWLYD